MALTEYKITASKLAQKGVCAAPDVLTGTPVENKAVFDRVVRELVATAVNEVIDYMAVVEQAEQTRGSAENERVAAEQQRAEAESARDTAYLWHTNDEVARQSAEQARAQAEQARVQAENERVQAESERATADLWRGNDEVARQSAEQARAQAEQMRVQVEQARVQAESERVQAESERATADLWRGNDEVARQSAEARRVQAEQVRVQAESERVQAESERATADLWRGNDEVARQSAEQARVQAERVRVQQETTRSTAEQSRASAESARNLWEVFDTAHTYQVGNKVTYHGSSYVCCAACTAVLPTDTAHWMLIAQKGADGTGAGDMRAEWYDPTRQERDVFAHERSVGNPHQVTKAQVGLGKVDNTADLDKPLSTAAQAALSSLESEVSDLAGYVGYTDADIYGVEVDFVNKRFTRLAGAVGKTAGAEFDSVHAFGGRRRCNVTDEGNVVAYYGDAAFTTTGALEQEIYGDTEVLFPLYDIGTPVQVMVEQPKFYYKVVPLLIEKKAKGGITRKVRYYISDTPKAGFQLHPAFIQNGVEKEKIYLSAFEGCLWDTSANAYLLDDTQVADFTADKLSSIAEAKPISGLTQSLTRANARKLAQNRGAGWELSYAATVSASQLLMLIEYASFNMQSAIGMGAVSKADDGSTNMAENTGATISLGNASGAVANAGGVQMVSYRGEENLWGNIWTWIDGVNELNPDSFADGDFGTLFVADHDFADGTDASPYKNTGIHPCYGSGYVSAFGYSEEFDWLFVPAEKKGNSALPVGDYFYSQNAGWRAAILGGRWGDGSYAGAFFLNVKDPASVRSRHISGRLVYIPQS